MNAILDERLIQILLRNVRIDPDSVEIGPHTDLINDLALDSIQIVNLFADLEEEFDITIDLSDISVPILGQFELFSNYLAGEIQKQPPHSPNETGRSEGARL